MQKSIEQIYSFDKNHIWHPYTSMINPLPTYAVESAKGVYLNLMDGSSLIDGMSSWWAAIHGYNHPVLNRALENQIKKTAHVMFGGITHTPAVELSELLIKITPPGLDRIFLSDSGSVSVEVAIKMAFQYWQSKNMSEKNKLITVRNGYHGDTFFAMSVCDPVNGMHSTFNNILPRHYFADQPACRFHDAWNDSHIHSIQNLIKKHHKECAAVILEPIVQGAGGMHFYSPQYLRKLKRLCDEYDIILILDEIATGFGRTGQLFGSNHADISPDIMCLGKALTGGYMTLAATLTTRKIAETISKGPCGALMHGPTFMGNPLACAVAVSSIRHLMSQDWQQNVSRIENLLFEGLKECSSMKGVADTRVLGAIGVVEMEKPVDMSVIQKKFVARRIWIRPFGRLIYTMPPYIIDDEQLQYLTRQICEVVHETGISS